MSIKINTVTAYATETSVSIAVKLPRMGVRNFPVNCNASFSDAFNGIVASLVELLRKYETLCDRAGIEPDRDAMCDCATEVYRFMLGEVFRDARDASGIDPDELCKMELHKVVGWYHTAQWSK